MLTEYLGTHDVYVVPRENLELIANELANEDKFLYAYKERGDFYGFVYTDKDNNFVLYEIQEKEYLENEEIENEKFLKKNVASQFKKLVSISEDEKISKVLYNKGRLIILSKKEDACC